MMFNFFLGILWFLALLFSVIFGISSSSMFMCWASLELNMLIFLLLMSALKFRSELPMVKYFIIQSLSSALFLFLLAVLSVWPLHTLSLEGIGLAMVVKMGGAPFHSWYISFLSLAPWEGLILVATLQKMLPVYMLQLVQFSWNFWVIVLSVYVGIYGSVSQSLLKKLIGYSSVFGVAWLVSVSNLSGVVFQFLLIYAWSLSALVMVVHQTGAYSFNSLSLKDVGDESGYLVFVCLFSMGGLPPFIGFYAKLLVIVALVSQGQLAVASLLVISAGWMLYLYVCAFIGTSLGGASGTLEVGPSNTKVSSFSVLMSLGLVGWLVLCTGVSHHKIWVYSV